MKKKLFSLIMVTTLVVSLVGCGKKTETPSTDDNKAETTQAPKATEEPVKAEDVTLKV